MRTSPSQSPPDSTRRRWAPTPPPSPPDLLDEVGADPATRGRTLLCPGPLVEGLVVAAATASTGADRHRVSADAAAALGPKRTHLGEAWDE